MTQTSQNEISVRVWDVHKHRQIDGLVSLLTKFGADTQTIGQTFFSVFHFICSLYQYTANVVKLYTKACRRVLSSTLLYLIGSESSCDLGSVT
jgi:hypothetical protein